MRLRHHRVTHAALAPVRPAGARDSFPQTLTECFVFEAIYDGIGARVEEGEENEPPVSCAIKKSGNKKLKDVIKRNASL